MTREICFIGFPSHVGGAELDRQLGVRQALAGLQVHLLPTGRIDDNLRAMRMDERDCAIYEPRGWSRCQRMHVISEGSDERLASDHKCLFHVVIRVFDLAISACHGGNVGLSGQQARVASIVYGDEVCLGVKSSNGIVTAVRHRVQGCLVCQASAEFVCQWAQGQPESTFLETSDRAYLSHLGTLTPMRQHDLRNRRLRWGRRSDEGDDRRSNRAG